MPVVRAGRSWAVPETEGQALVQHVSGSGPEATPSPHTAPAPCPRVLLFSLWLPPCAAQFGVYFLIQFPAAI